MRELPFLDIHTHLANSSGLAIYNLDQLEIRKMAAVDQPVESNGDVFSARTASGGTRPTAISPDATSLPLLSAGIHPWFVDKNKLGKQLRQLEKLAGNSRVRLIGECGLDKLRGPEMEIQKIAFAAQIQLANHYQKPLVIHCVRAYNELIAVTKVTPPKVPLILHGFNRGPELARQLTDHGYLLSFGANLAQKKPKENTPVALALQQCWDKGQAFFLETDNSTLSIEEIYKHAANLLKISEDALKDAIFASWKKIGLNHE